MGVESGLYTTGRPGSASFAAFGSEGDSLKKLASMSFEFPGQGRTKALIDTAVDRNKVGAHGRAVLLAAQLAVKLVVDILAAIDGVASGGG